MTAAQAADRQGEGQSRLRRPRAEERQCGAVRHSCSAGPGDHHRRRPHAADRHAGGDRGGESTRRSCGTARRRAWSGSTGTSARPRSGRAARRCGWTASASRRRWWTRPSPRSRWSGSRRCRPGRRRSIRRTFIDGIGIPAAGKNKKAAWLYVQWATSKAMLNELLRTGSGTPARHSIYSRPRDREDQRLPAGMVRHHADQPEDRALRPAGDRAGDGVPRHDRRRADQHRRRRRSGDRVEEGDGDVQAGAGEGACRGQTPRRR